ncbi:hypothetical protein SAMN05421766_102207 [Zobellia uliginosa]|uniref:Uncharacterized protein n=1 Tax=Zobellia uliginosa TaxID=143224 RepID=A0ABY1KLS1_9FLAO|nr:hypothetical protein [Zobellia uliginosa]SIS48043.1 hypothetical protein SAMN05421766_102207 [Zobellia uliginosa]
MKTNSLTLIALLLYTAAFSQLQSIKAEHLNFKIKSDFTLSDTDGMPIQLTDTVSIGNETIIKTVSVSPQAMNPITNNIKDISDILDLETLSVIQDNFVKENEIDGTTEINGRKILFRENFTEIYKDYNLTELIGYEYSNVYYFFSSKDWISSIEYVVRTDIKEEKIPDPYVVAKQMAKHINLGDINVIINSLEQ